MLGLATSLSVRQRHCFQLHQLRRISTKRFWKTVDVSPAAGAEVRRPPPDVPTTATLQLLCVLWCCETWSTGLRGACSCLWSLAHSNLLPAPSTPNPCYSQAGQGYQVSLDGKPLRTPAKNALVVPSKSLALAIAAEWEWLVSGAARRAVGSAHTLYPCVSRPSCTHAPFHLERSPIAC